jgi:N-glycosylase/DNA lyase
MKTNSRQNELIEKIKIAQSEVKPLVEKRLKEFDSVNKKGNEEWFHELCYCILTANTSAKMGKKIQDNVSVEEFLYMKPDKLKKKLNDLRCRFYNKRTEYIVEARKFAKIKDLLQNLSRNEKREFIHDNIKGIGLKEASHFLRNTGHYDFAILDKHVKNILKEHDFISEKIATSSMTSKNYIEIEKSLKEIADKLNMSQGEMDFYIWYMKTGEVLK